MKKMGSLFDGIGGFPLAAQRNGIIPVWASEIEKWPIKVTKKHFPNMKHLGDITQINGAEIEPVDIITFGSPCQNLSVAGKQEGLKGEQSCLFYEAIRIIREMREKTNGSYPRYAVWENVPGAFSSNKRQDFRAVLEEITETEIPMPESGKWANAGMVRGNGRSVAWRVLDAQYWGVPQRRKRIFLVADFRGQSAPEILFECEGMSGDITESGKEGQGTAAGIGEGVTTAIPIDTMTAQGRPSDKGRMGSGIGKPGDPANTISAAHCHAVLTEVAAGIEDGINSTVTFRNVAGTLRANAGAPKHEADWEQLVCKVAPFNTGLVAFACNQRDEVRDMKDKSGALQAQPGMRQQTFVLIGRAGAEQFMFENHSQDTRYKGPLEVAQPVTATYGMGGNNQPFVVKATRHDRITSPQTSKISFGIQGSMIGRADKNGPQGNGINQEVSFTLNTTDRHAVANQGDNYSVRRLTPLECLRLQGFPDDWLDIEGMSDTQKYKAIGNSLAVPCVEFIMQRIKEVKK